MKSELDGLNTEPLITKVEPRPVDLYRDKTPSTTFTRLVEPIEAPKLSFADPEKPTIFETLAHTAEMTWFYVRLMPYFTKTIGGLVMNDWKTTLTGVLGAVAYAINYFTGITVPQETILLATTVIGLWLAKDGKKQP